MNYSKKYQSKNSSASFYSNLWVQLRLVDLAMGKGESKTGDSDPLKNPANKKDVALPERVLLNQYPEISNDSGTSIEENDSNKEPWTLYTFSYEETPVDRQEWKSLSTEEIVTEKLGLDYASVLNSFKEANPADARWMNLWIKRCIIDKGWNENDPIPNIRETEVWKDPTTGEPVIEAFSFSEARKKAKEIGVADFETFFWQRKISGKKEHIMKGYQGPEIYYNQTHLSGKNYQQMINELYKVSGDNPAYQNALQDGEIGQAFVDLVKSAQEVVFFNKPDLDKYRDGLFGNDTRNAINTYLTEIKGRDPYVEAMIRRFARKKSITLENARRITADFWKRPDVIQTQNQAADIEAYQRLNNPGFDTNLKVAMARQSESVRKDMEQQYSIYRVGSTNAKLEANLQKEVSQLTSSNQQIASQLMKEFPPKKTVEKKPGNTAATPQLPNGGFYNPLNPNLIPLYQPYFINSTFSSYTTPSIFKWGNAPFKFNLEKHPYSPNIDANTLNPTNLIKGFNYWKKWENEEAEMNQIKGQSQTLKDQSLEMKYADDLFIKAVSTELGYTNDGKSTDQLTKKTVYLSALEQQEQKTFYQAWLELKDQFNTFPEAEKKSGKLPPKIVTTYNQFTRLLFAHGNQVSPNKPMTSEDFKGISVQPEMILKSPENFKDLQSKITSYRKMIRLMLEKEIQTVKDPDIKRNLTDYLQQNIVAKRQHSLVQKAHNKAKSSGHTFTKTAATFTTYWDNRENEQSFSGPYTKVETKAQDIQMYVEKNGHVIVVHLFLGASEDNHFQFTGSSISDALTKMNAVKGVLPNGVIRYQTENGWYQEFIVDPPSWTTSEVLGVASLVLAVIAIPVTGGASVALVVASTATGITSSGFAMYEENLKGQLSTGETWQHSGFMVANLLPMVRGISTLAKLSKTSGLLGKIGTVTQGYNYLKASVGVGVGATTIDGIIIADSYYTKFKEIDKMTHLSREARDAERAQLLREGLITGMITLTGLLDLASLKKPRSNNSKHWSGTDVPTTGKSKSTGIASTSADGNATHQLTGGTEQTATKQLSGSTPQSTVPGKKKTTKVVVAQDPEGNFHKQNPETGEFKPITKEEFEQLELTTKNKGGEVVKSQKNGKLEEISLDMNLPKDTWLLWSQYPKEVINGEEFAIIGNRYFSQSAVESMVPSGLGGSGVLPGVIDDVINNGDNIIINAQKRFEKDAIFVFTEKNEYIVRSIRVNKVNSISDLAANPQNIFGYVDNELDALLIQDGWTKGSYSGKSDAVMYFKQTNAGRSEIVFNYGGGLHSEGQTFKKPYYYKLEGPEFGKRIRVIDRQTYPVDEFENAIDLENFKLVDGPTGTIWKQ